MVDDEESVRKALIRLLRAANMDAESFASGEAFLNSLDKFRPDCVVLDLQMPGLTGRDVQKRLMSMKINLPVILITAHDDVVTQQQSLSDGAANYLRKPLRGDVLVRSINESIARAAGATPAGTAGGHRT
ncbi:MAG TPA: response regulator [Steroidobacteraceae bacterium]|nr:response regulator [Steroidobacteraceae bacterium]